MGDKRFEDMMDRIANDKWEANIDNLFAYLRENEILKVSEELIRKKYKLD